jgi:hypothetical protein
MGIANYFFRKIAKYGIDKGIEMRDAYYMVQKVLSHPVL